MRNNGVQNKLKVETLSSSIIQKRTKIKDYLKAHPEGATPKMIASATSINVNTVKSILPKLENVTTSIRGLYKVLNGGDGVLISDGTFKAWNFHNLYLTFPVCYNNRDNFELDYDMIKIRVDIVNYKATVCISTDVPLPLTCLRLLNDLLNQHLNTKLSMDDMIISSIEFNQDFDGYKLEGVKCMSMHTLYSQYKLYEKQRGVRLEHKTKVPFPMSYVGDLLTQAPDKVNMVTRLNDNTAKLNKLMTQSIYNTQQLTKLIEAMKT